MFFVQCKNNGNKESLYEQDSDQSGILYTCPMHPEIVKNEPGKCPICGMNLVEMQDTGLSMLLKPTDKFVISQVKTISPVKKSLPVTIEASGIIDYDASEINTIASRVSGRIEKLYVKYRFQNITRGQRLFDIYSPELVNDQENLIYLLKNDSANKLLIKSTEEKLILQGLTQSQVIELKKTKKSFYSLPVFSPYSGHLHVQANGFGMSNEMSKSPTKNDEIAIKEGVYVERGEPVFYIYGIKKVWALLNIFAEQSEKVKPGQKVQLTVGSDYVNAKIDFIEPFIRPGQSFVTVRCYLDNSNKEYTIGTRVKAIIESGLTEGLYVPSSAVLSLGQKQVVFVKKGAVFQSKQIDVGYKDSEWIQITGGLGMTDVIVSNAQLLMDSESFVRSDK